MAINVSQPFHRTSANAVDDTLTLTKAEMLAVNDNLMPSKYLTVCQDDGFIYLYDKSATPNQTTGKFTKFEGGGSSLTAGDGIDITNDVISTDNLQSGDMSDIISPVPTPSSHSVALDELTNVSISDPQNGNALVYDSANNLWKNGEGTGGGTTYTAGDGIQIDQNNEISTDNLQSGDMDDIIPTLPSIRSDYTRYSTTEQVVGEWINGKPIYQKTISGQMPNANDTVSIAHGISDLDIVVELDAIAHKPTTHKNFLLPIVGDGYNESYKKQSLISIASDYLYLRNYGDDYSAYTAYITMKYTKTTD